MVVMEPDAGSGPHRPQDIADVEAVHSSQGGRSGEEDGVTRPQHCRAGFLAISSG